MTNRSGLSRRAWLGLALGAPWVATGQTSSPPAPENPFWARGRRGGCLFVMRHSETELGVGDPPGFDLNRCATQRNLSERGRAQAKRLGERFEAEGVVLQEVLSSAWCRCKDTADLAFGRHTVWSPLNSFFETPEQNHPQTQSLRSALGAVQAPAHTMWVTHQVNITALTGLVPAMGEVFILDNRFTGPGPVPVLARWRV